MGCIAKRLRAFEFRVLSVELNPKSETRDAKPETLECSILTGDHMKRSTSRILTTHARSLARR